MGELFDNLLGMLPAVLFFLFIMRRLFGRRGGARKAEGAEGGDGITGGEANRTVRLAEPAAALVHVPPWVREHAHGPRVARGGPATR